MDMQDGNGGWKAPVFKNAVAPPFRNRFRAVAVRAAGEKSPALPEKTAIGLQHRRIFGFLSGAIKAIDAFIALFYCFNCRSIRLSIVSPHSGCALSSEIRTTNCLQIR